MTRGAQLPATAFSDLRQASVRPREDIGELLSERQIAALLRAIQGRPNTVIAAELGIAEGTVKTYLSSAFKVTGVHNRSEALFAAARRGLVPEPEQVPVD